MCCSAVFVLVAILHSGRHPPPPITCDGWARHADGCNAAECKGLLVEELRADAEAPDYLPFSLD